MTTYTFDPYLVSDLHKDARGRRPSDVFWQFWNIASDAGKQRLWDDLRRELEASERREQALRDRAIASFSDRVRRLREDGESIHRAVALVAGDAGVEWERFLDYGWEVVEYEMSLPYGFIKRFIAEEGE